MAENSLVHALSIKQPWAALVVAGLKTIEIRRWPTARRGRILIHAARIGDSRGDAWKHVTAEMEPLANLQGGIIGSAELTECRRYDGLTTFVTDQANHLNESTWFEPPLLYGFVFTNPQVLPFTSFPGWFRFFKVDWPHDLQYKPESQMKEPAVTQARASH